MYKQCKNSETGELFDRVKRLSDQSFIPFDPANSDFANFKKEINAETAELQDAEGNTMTAAEAKAYVATLP
jgi:hypothetical protein